MEASGAEQGAAPAAAEGEGAGGLDFSPVLEHVDKLGQTVDQRFQELEGRLPAQQEPDPYGGQFGQQQADQFGAGLYGQPQPGQPQQPGQQGMYDEYGNLTPEGAQAQLQQALQPTLGPLTQQFQQMQQQNQELMQTVEGLRMDRGAERLETTYPELKDAEKADALVQAALPLAQRIGRPDLVGDDGFLELVYKAQRADAAAASETPAGPGPSLEPGGGASLAGSEPNVAQSIVAAGKAGRFWGV